MQAPRNVPGGPQLPSAGAVAHAPLSGAEMKDKAGATGKKEQAVPPSASDTTAQPAMLSLEDGKLTVEANNSDLIQILQNLARISGMTIEGLNTSTRVFGVYGPGNPRDVLTDLLDGSGYNFLMVGDRTDGAPRELLLSTQNKAPALTAPQAPAVKIAPPAAEPLGPGAVAHVSPAEAQNSDDPSDRTRRTLQRLQQMHDQQQQDAPQ